MKKTLCPTLEEELLLLAAGEPPGDPARREILEAHWRQCAACRAERERLGLLFAAARRAGVSPALSPAQVNALSAAVRGELEGKRSRFRGWRLPWGGGWIPRPLPAVAAALVLLAVAVGGVRFLPDRAEAPGEAEFAAEWSPRDLEVIRHLELLRELETIEKLVHVVDLPDALPGVPGGAEEERQERGNEVPDEKTA
ncbi:MAG: hypothetical protein WHT06_01875 [Desulfobacterales bacterium]